MINVMKKLIRVLETASLSAAVSLSIAAPAFADSLNLCPKDGTGFGPLCSKATSDKTGNILGFLINIAFIFAVVIALFYLIWGGIKWILSGGDKAAVETARATIVAAVIGLIVTFAAYFILNVVVGIFIPGFQLNNIQLPSINNL